MAKGSRPSLSSATGCKTWSKREEEGGGMEVRASERVMFLI
jgi:hypothetical protein